MPCSPGTTMGPAFLLVFPLLLVLSTPCDACECKCSILRHFTAYQMSVSQGRHQRSIRPGGWWVSQWSVEMQRSGAWLLGNRSPEISDGGLWVNDPFLSPPSYNRYYTGRGNDTAQNEATESTPPGETQHLFTSYPPSFKISKPPNLCLRREVAVFWYQQLLWAETECPALSIPPITDTQFPKKNFHHFYIHTQRGLG